MLSAQPAKTKTDMCCGSSTMSTDPKESCGRDLSEFDEKNEILTVNYVSSDYDGEKRGTRVSAIITSGFNSDEELDTSSEPATPLVMHFDPKISYGELLELRRQKFSISLTEQKLSSG